MSLKTLVESVIRFSLIAPRLLDLSSTSMSSGLGEALEDLAQTSQLFPIESHRFGREHWRGGCAVD